MLCIIVCDLLIIYNSAVKQKGFQHYSEWECDAEDNCNEMSSFSSSCDGTQLRVRKIVKILSHDGYDGLCISSCSYLETLKMSFCLLVPCAVNAKGRWSLRCKRINKVEK